MGDRYAEVEWNNQNRSDAQIMEQKVLKELGLFALMNSEKYFDKNLENFNKALNLLNSRLFAYSGKVKILSSTGFFKVKNVYDYNETFSKDFESYFLRLDYIVNYLYKAAAILIQNNSNEFKSLGTNITIFSPFTRYKKSVDYLNTVFGQVKKGSAKGKLDEIPEICNTFLNSYMQLGEDFKKEVPQLVNIFKAVSEKLDKVPNLTEKAA